MTETREAPTPREVEIERIAAALHRLNCTLVGCRGVENELPEHGARYIEDAEQAFLAGLRFPVPPDPGTAAKVREAEARPADGWHLTHSCGGFRREITRLKKGEAFMCVVCGEWCRVVVTPEARALLSEREGEG